MTRKEIEKRCLEEMQQTIPDSEALWQRIEEQLPPQESPKQQPAIQMTTLRRIMAGAACFLLIAAGIQVFRQMEPMQHENTSEQSDSLPQNDLQEDAANEGDAGFDDMQVISPTQNSNAMQETSGIRSYASLQLAESESTKVHVLDPEMLTAGSQLFHEASVLEQTECFVDVKVRSGSQSPETGEMTYLIEVVDAYGEAERVYGTDKFAAGDVFWIHTSSPYLLKADREYVLPLYKEEGQWRLVNESAPQIELTLDDEAVFHSGWRSLMETEWEPLLYASQGSDDYFYDRMYLTQGAVLRDFLIEWEETHNA